MDAVEEVKSRLNIEDVISEYVQLKRSGRNFKGLSPFTSERTPSFMVSPEKGIWHDFSSGKGGNIFSFVMEMEGLEFKEALDLLARRANVDLEQFRGSGGTGNAKSKERLYAANEQAAKFYQVQFSRNTAALEYVFKKRRFSKEIALAFQLGYAPNTGNALVNYLTKQGFTKEELSRAGLTNRYGGDMFRGRLMVPLQDQQGRVIGFTARQLEADDNGPKYLNTPQTLLYDKSRHIYGLHLAKESLRKENYAVLVEGNLDVIASHQAGVRNVVATAGTALTEQHLKGISRFTPDVRLAFDQDNAGQTATERAIPIAAKVGVRLSVVTIPEGKDPDELIKKDPALWTKAIGQPHYAIDWLIDRYSQQLDLTKAPDKRQFSDTLVTVIRQLPDSVEQDHYVQRLADLLGVNADAMRSKLRETSSQRSNLKKNKQAVVVPDRTAIERKKLQDQLLALGLMRPALRTYLEGLEPEILLDADAKDLLSYLQEHPDFDGKIAGARLKKIGEYSKVLSLQYETLYQDQDDVDLGQEAKRLKNRLIEQYIKTKKADIAAALQDADESAQQVLLEQAKTLDEQLKRLM